MGDIGIQIKYGPASWTETMTGTLSTPLIFSSGGVEQFDSSTVRLFLKCDFPTNTFNINLSSSWDTTYTPDYIQPDLSYLRTNYKGWYGNNSQNDRIPFSYSSTISDSAITIRIDSKTISRCATRLYRGTITEGKQILQDDISKMNADTALTYQVKLIYFPQIKIGYYIPSIT